MDEGWTLMVLCVCRKLQFRPLSTEVPVLFRVVELPHKQHLCKVKSLNKGDANSEVTVYYQVGPLQDVRVSPSPLLLCDSVCVCCSRG